MATEQVLAFNVASVVADVLQQHGPRFSDINFASRKADEACNDLHFFIFFLI